ncbi:MAG TPA: hypothetical protein O0X32_02210, partial [Methanocorpusculum sp.]|nr:hypothetical protein [Methanocorpusculum sp.]
MKLNYIPTTCPHCGTGCGMNLIVTDKGVTGIAPYQRSVINRGKLCNNGQAVAAELVAMPRIAKPMVAGKEVTLDAAIAEVKKLSGAEILVSPRLTSETIYLADRYAKEVQKTSGAVTLTDLYKGGNAKMTDISGADVILFIGDCMRKLPVTGGNALRAKDKGAKLLYAGKAQTYTSVQADEVAVLNDAFEIPAGFTDALKGAKAGVVVTTAGNKFVADAEKYAKSVNAKFAVLYTTNNGKGTLSLGCKDIRADWEKAVPKTAIVFTDAISGDEKFFQKVVPILEKIENLV